MMEADRLCEVCGKTIPRRGGAWAEYVERRYCSLRCSGKAKTLAFAARTVDEQKTCARCGIVFRRPPGLSQAGWEQRSYCSAACQRAGAHTPVLCDCGQGATKTIYFTQARADGSIMPGALLVCADCYEYMMEHDGGCSAEPVAFDQRIRLWTEDVQESYSPPHGGFAYRRSYHE